MHSVMSDSLWPHGLRHTRPPCPSLSSGVCSNSCSLIRWCHPTISSSVVPFSSHIQSFPASGFFSKESDLCIRCPQYWSFSFNISHSNEYSGFISFRIHWFDLLAFQETLKSLLQHHVWKHQFFGTQPFLLSNSHLYMTTGNIWRFVGKVMSLLFIMLSMLFFEGASSFYISLINNFK